MSGGPAAYRQFCGEILLALAVAMTIGGQAAAQAEATKSANAQPSQQEILQELAVTQRMLADEEFIAGDRDNAKADYTSAEATIGELTADGGFLTPADIQLQKDEIAYRKLLLDRQGSFWGLEFATRPVNPVAAVGQFERTYKRFSELVGDIDLYTDKLKAGDHAQITLEDQQIQNERDQRVAELQQDISAVRLRDAETRRSMYQDRKAAIQARQTAILAEISALQKQVADRSAAMNATLVRAITDELGMPPETAGILAGAAKGDYSGVVDSAVQQYASSPDAADGLSGELKELTLSAQAAAQEYQEVRQTVTDAQDKASRAAALLKAVQSNDRDRLIAIGLQVMGQLSPETRTQLATGLDKVKDLQKALELAGSGTHVRAEIATYIAAAPDLSAKVGPLVATYLKPGQDAFASRYQRFLAAEISVADSAASQTTVLGALSRGWARTLVHDVLDAQGGVVAIAKSVGSLCATDLDCVDWLTDYVSQNGLGGPTIAVTAAGDVTVTVKGNVAAHFSLDELGRASKGRIVETTPAAIQSDVDALVARLEAGSADLVAEVVRRLPDTDFDRDLAPQLAALSGLRAAALVQALTSTDVDSSPSPATLDATALALGREIARKTVFASAPEIPTAQADETGPVVELPTADGPDPGKEIVLTAMKAFGPYGYAAAAAIEIFSGIAQNGVAIEQINTKTQEDHDLTVEMLHITAFEQDLNRDEAIATLEQRIATAQYNSAGSRSDLYEQAMIDEGTQDTALQAKIRRRLPLVYLLSEQLREEFDAVDHSLGFWENDVSQDGSFLERSVRSDPQLRRLALDPDISLYDWFRRDAEGQRQDLDALFVHWQQVETVISGSLCQRFHCAANDARMGRVEMTELISLRQLVGPDTWKATAQSRSLLFTILPKTLPNLPARDGLRLVHISGGVPRADGSFKIDPNIVLRHSGLGYVSIGGKGYRETLETSGDFTPALPLADGKSSELRDSLQGRWSPNPTLEPLEGYPLFGLYKVQFSPTFDFSSDDLVLRFYYQWPVYSALLHQQGATLHFSCADISGRTVAVSSADVALLLNRDVSGKPTLDASQTCALTETAQ